MLTKHRVFAKLQVAKNLSGQLERVRHSTLCLNCGSGALLLRFHLFLHKKAGPRFPANGQRGPEIMCLNLRRISTAVLFSVIVWSCNGNKAARAGNDHIVCAAGAVDHQQAAVLGSAADDACMEIVRVAMKEAEGDGWID